MAYNRSADMHLMLSVCLHLHLSNFPLCGALYGALFVCRLEVSQQYIADESDPWLQRETRILKSFTR